MDRAPTLDELIAAGLVLPPGTTLPAPPAMPLAATGAESSLEILLRHRDRFSTSQQMAEAAGSEGSEDE